MEQRKKVLFLVYRAGWWGCFDELYREHKADSGCQCSVVVLPRYDRDPQTHEIISDRYRYDTDAMPRDVEVTDFRKYSLPNERPDVIYIHNLYDNSNILDSVPVEYYSWNLKQFTPRLVYVHHRLWFTALDLKYNIYHYVDKIYINTDRDKYGFPVEFADKLEIVPSGIVPYLLRRQRLKPVPPKETAVTLFISVGYDELYYGTDRALRKLEQVLKLLKGRRDFRVILHSDQELQDHFHELQGSVASEYIRIINWFVDKKIGVYDVSDNDCEAALNADIIMALGGTPVMNCFSALGKPCFSLNRECRPLPAEDDLCIPNFCYCAVEGDEVTFVTDPLSLMCRMNLKTGKMKVLGGVPDEGEGWANYPDIQKKGNTCYLLPYTSDGLLLYDEQSGRYEKKYFPNAVSTGNFTQMIFYRQYLYLIPRFYKGILRYDTESGESRVFDTWVREVDRLAEPQNQQEPYFICGIRQEGHMLQMASSKAGVIMHFDMETGEYELEETGIPGGRFLDMEWREGKPFLLPWKGSTVYARSAHDSGWEAVYEAEECETPNVPYARCAQIGQKTVVLPQQAANVLVCDEADGQIRERRDVVCCGRDAYQSEYMRERKAGYTVVKKMDNGALLLYEQYTGAVHLLDERLHVIKRISCRLPYSDVIACYKRLCAQNRKKWNCFNSVGEWYPLPVMLEYLKSVCRDEEFLRENRRRFLETNYCLGK